MDAAAGNAVKANTNKQNNQRRFKMAKSKSTTYSIRVKEKNIKPIEDARKVRNPDTGENWTEEAILVKGAEVVLAAKA